MYTSYYSLPAYEYMCRWRGSIKPSRAVWDVFKRRVAKFRAMRDVNTYKADIKSAKIKYRREPRINLRLIKEIQE